MREAAISRSKTRAASEPSYRTHSGTSTAAISSSRCGTPMGLVRDAHSWIRIV